MPVQLMNRLSHTFALLAIAAAAPASAAFTVDFDTASDLTDNFVENGGTSVTTYSWTDTTGVGSPDGAITSPNDGDTSEPALFYTPDTFNPADGPLEASVFFQASAATSSGNSRNFVGFANNDGINIATDSGKIGVRVFKGGSTDFTLQLQNNTSTTDVGSSFSLTDGNWYRMSTTVTELSPGSYQLAGELLDYGVDGTTLNASFSRAGSTTVSNGNLQPDTTWTVALLNQDNAGGATAMDNLSAGVVPEPASLALVALGSGLILSRRR